MSAPDPAPGRRDSRAAARIRDAAIASFAEVGYGGTSTRQIAKRLNLSAAAMYPHYRSKEELLYAISVDGHRDTLAQLRAADASVDPSEGAVGRLRAVVGAFVRWQADHHDLAKVVQYELHGLTDDHYREVTAIRRDTSAILARVVDEGLATGEFDVDDAGDVVLAISSLCVDVCRWFPSRTHSDADALARAYADLAVRMVAPRG